MKAYILGASVYALVAVGGLLAGSRAAQAQVANSSQSNRATVGELETIVVTAQKREERLHDVPVSISAVTAADIDAKNVTSLAALQFAVPGLTITGPPGEEYISIRGISNETGAALVGVYLDEMPINADKVQLGATGTIMDVRLLDMERVEVLRGPQGTLYGQGSMGGTIRYITASPDLKNYSGAVEGQLGQIADGGGQSYKANAVVSLPLVENKLGLRLVGGYERDGGWIDNTVTGRSKINGIDFKTFRGKLLARPTDRLELSLLYLHQDQDQDNINRGLNGKVASTVETSLHDRGDLINGTLKFNFGSVSVLETIGYIDRAINLQSDLTPNFLPFLINVFGLPPGFITQIPIHEPSTQRVFADELRFFSNTQGVFNWTAGAYYRKAHSHLDYQTSTAPGQLPFTLLEIEQTTDSESYALFGDVSYKLTDHLTTDLGVRYFHDRANVDAFNVFAGGKTGPFQSVGNFHSVDPRFNLSYAFSPASMIYVNAAKGFRSGGFNAAAHGPGVPLSYQPDELWNYEFGTKQQLLDRRLEIDADVYYVDWTNVQAPVNLQPSNTAVTINSGRVAGWGTDISLAVRPSQGLTLTGSIGWNNLAYKTADPFTSGPLVGGPPDDAVRRSYSVSLDYRRPVFGATVGFFHADYQHAGEAQETNGGRIVIVPRHNLSNLRAGLDFGRIEASVFANNTANDRTLAFPAAFGNPVGVEQTPRTIGVNVRARF